ncbi:MAG: hypothetical protein AAB723_01235, partial [Patescibacteria group bacterium]
LPEGWVIYTKDHPSQWAPRGVNFSSVRYEGYYKRIAKIPKVCVIPIETDTYLLIDRSQMVVSVTGTAVWEALFRGRPGLIFGYPWYQNCPLILRAQDVESCRNAIDLVLRGFKPNKQRVINFLKSLEEATVHGYFDFGYGKNISKINDRESADNFKNIILNEINTVN